MKKRKRTIAQISTQHNVNADSNYCFGEGGAGTFSDGKLVTGVNSPLIKEVLNTFYKFGAPKQKYRLQVGEYIRLYQKMGYKKVFGYLWYVPENKVEII